MRISRRTLWTTLAIVVVVVLLGIAADGIFSSKPPVAAPPDTRPRVLISMGDSTISGEGAGYFAPGTDGQNGDWCHRSTKAEVHDTGLTGLKNTINLACSGATAENVGLGDQKHYTEGSQAAQLAPIAAKNHVVAIVVAMGANDDPQFANVLDSCVEAFFKRDQAGCSGGGFGKQWQQRVNAMEPKVVHALKDIRTVMSRDGYADGSYQLILQGYAAPIGPDVAPGLDSAAGCPFTSADLNWVRNTGVKVLDNGLHSAADQAGVRFLDLASAGIGHEACSGGKNPANEWFTRLSVDWQDLTDADRAGHALQSSFHPNASAQAAFGRCLAQFVGTTDRAATCLPDKSGTLHPAALPNTQR
jgi:GDSL-like Lipase/Acylhydrolase family